MPQNAIIRADGTGDYTTPQAWEAAEQSSNYGSITVGRVDGFFDSGSSQLDINGSWPNGARLEAFSSAGAFDGTERQLCGITSTGITVRGRGNKTELSGLEIYSTTTQGAYIATTSGGDTNITSCLLRTNSGNNRLNSLVGSGYVDCVLASDSGGSYSLATVGTGNSIFLNTTSAAGSSSTTTLSDTVVYNQDTGSCFRGSVTQSNNASTDATADTLTNIVVADFVSTTPIASKDYRIKSGSPLDTNGIGSFVQASSGPTITVTSIATAQIISNVTLTTQGSLSVDSLTNAQSTSSPIITQQSILSSDNLLTAQTLSNVDLIVAGGLDVNSLLTANAITSPALIQANALNVNSILNASAISSPTLTQANVLSVDSIITGQTLSNVSLLVSGALSVDDLLNANTISNASIIQQYLLNVNPISSAQTLSNITLAVDGQLIVNAIQNSQAISNTGLITHAVLITNNITNDQLIGTVTLNQENIGVVTAAFKANAIGVEYGLATFTVKFKG